MKYYRLSENKSGKIIVGLLLFALLYLTRTGLTASALVGINRAQFLTLGIICAVGVLFLVRNRDQWKELLLDKRMLLGIVCAVVLLLPAVLKRDFQMMYLSVLLCVMIGIFLSYFVSLKDAAKYYVLFLTMLAVWSVLAAYILRRLPDNGIVSVPIFFTSRKVEFYNFGLSYVARFYVKNRNFGIFREPGVYQFFIMLALFLNNYTVQWKKQSTMWVINVILAVTMLTTLATGGVAELGLFVILVFFEKKLYKNKMAIITAVIVVVGMVAGLAVICMQKGELYWELYGMVIAKIFGGEASSTDRLNALLVDLAYFRSNPLLGEQIATVLTAVEHNTASTMLMLAMFGIGGGALHIAAWAALVWDRKRNAVANVALLIIMLLSVNTQNFVADQFFWLFPVMALTEKCVPLLEKKV